MRIQSYLLAAALMGCASAFAQAPAPAADAAEIAQRAETLTEAQIKQSKDIPALGRLEQIYEDKGDLDRLTWAFERLVELMPNSGLLKLQLAMAYSAADEKTKAYDLLVRMQMQGFGFDISKDPRFENIHGTKVWDYIVANLQANAKQFGEGKLAFEIPKGDRLIESIAYDPKRKQFLLGSLREGKVYLADESGKLGDFIKADEENGMWAVYALAVDAAHDRLYVTSAGVPYYRGFKADSFGKAGLFEFELSSGKFLHKYILPQDTEAHTLTSIALAPNGTVFVADAVRRQIFKLDGGALRLVFEGPKLSSIRGMAISSDGKTLYFADYALGLFGIDLAKGEPFAVAHNPERLVVGGIDGMSWYDGHLIIVESGMSPQRVMRLELSSDGRAIAGAMPLDVAQPAFKEPTVGTVVGDKYYFLATSDKGLYDTNGVLTEQSKLAPVRVFRSNLRFAWGQKGVGSAALTNVPAAKPAEVQQMLNAPAKGFDRVKPAEPKADPTKP